MTQLGMFDNNQTTTAQDNDAMSMEKTRKKREVNPVKADLIESRNDWIRKDYALLIKQRKTVKGIPFSVDREQVIDHLCHRYGLQASYIESIIFS